MTAYTLREPFTLDDALALLGKTADITVEADPDEGHMETWPAVIVAEVLQIPGTGRGYMHLTYAGLGEPLAVAPFGDVRAVDNIREEPADG